MVSIPALWLPILLSAVLVFVVSSIVHMVLPHHRTDFKKLPNEDKLRAAIRAENVPPGDYLFPCPKDPKDMSSPEMQAKYKEGPIGVMTVLPTGAPAMGKQLVQWFVYCIVAGIGVAYLAGRTLGPAAEYLTVFRVAGTTAFYIYAGAQLINSIWMGRAWSTSVKNAFDGLLYALVTAGAFGWLWPQ
jgi:hypothetical protein